MKRPKWVWRDRKGPRYISEEEVSAGVFIKQVLLNLDSGGPNYDQSVADEGCKRFYKEGTLIGFIPKNENQNQPLRFIRVHCDRPDPGMDKWEIIENE